MTEPIPDQTQALQDAVADLFSVESIMLDAHAAGVVRLYGRFIADTAEAYPIVAERFRALGYTPFFREEGSRPLILAVPGHLPSAKPKVWLQAVLFAATVVSVLAAWVLFNWTGEIQDLPAVLRDAALFAGTLLGILVAHESGHYIVSRRLGIPASLPYFIPMPLSLLGTMGAVIVTRVPPRNRRHLLFLGMAGPLAGLIVAIPALVIGLSLSPVERLAPLGEQGYGYSLEGNSILYGLVKTAVFGRFLPDCDPQTPTTLGEAIRTALSGCPYATGEDVLIGPVAFAAWAGLLVTALNLIPAGTLDGGHVAYALLGKRSYGLTRLVIIGLLGLGMWGAVRGFLQGQMQFFYGTLVWFLWAGLVSSFGRRPAVPLDDVTRLKGWQMALGLLVLLIFVLTFTPLPWLAIAPPAGP